MTDIVRKAWKEGWQSCYGHEPRHQDAVWNQSQARQDSERLQAVLDAVDSVINYWTTLPMAASTMDDLVFNLSQARDYLKHPELENRNGDDNARHAP